MSGSRKVEIANGSRQRTGEFNFAIGSGMPPASIHGLVHRAANRKRNMDYQDGCEIKIDVLIGEVLTHIDTDEKNNEIMLTTQSGKIVKIYHNQDCCESVRIEDTQGNWHDLVGKVIIEASEDVKPQGDPPPEYPDSWTRTALTFRVDGATVISRWIGESNGYYSETVNIEDVTKSVR